MNRLSIVIRKLACGVGGIKDRLGDAAAVFVAETESIPDHLAKEHEEIMRALTEEGSYQETIDAMTDREASEVAKKLFYLFVQFAESERITHRR